MDEGSIYPTSSNFLGKVVRRYHHDSQVGVFVPLDNASEAGNQDRALHTTNRYMEKLLNPKPNDCVQRSLNSCVRILACNKNMQADIDLDFRPSDEQRTRLTLFRACLVQNVHRLELRRPSLLWLPFEIKNLHSGMLSVIQILRVKASRSLSTRTVDHTTQPTIFTAPLPHSTKPDVLAFSL